MMTSISANVSLSGKLTVGTVIAGRAALLDALERSTTIVVDIPSDTPIDVSGIQLIDAARMQAAQLGKTFSLATPASGSVLEVLELCGALDPSSPDACAFWLQKGPRP